MKYHIISALRILLFFGVFGVYAQSHQEHVYLRVNTASLLSGESLYYKIYVLDESNKPSSLSKLAYIELFDGKKNTVTKQKVLVNEGIASGDLFIDKEIASGSYKLIAYTNEALKNTELFQTDLLVVNPYQNNFENWESSSDTTGTSQEIVKKDVVIKSSDLLLLNNHEFGKREKVVVNFDREILKNTSFLEGNYSLSVRKIDAFSKIESIPESKNFKHYLFKDASLDTKQITAEFRGNIISGKLTGDDIANKTITASVPGNPFQFKLATTNENGDFYLVLDNPLPSSTVYLQPLNTTDALVTIDSFYIPKKAIREIKSYDLKLAMQPDIAERAVADQIENAYYDYKRDTLLEVANESVKKFYAPLEKIYYLDDFTRFPTMQETIVEIVKELYFKKKKGKYTLHSRDYENEYSENLFGETLIFIDGIIIRDTDQFFNYDARKIDRIEVVNSGYFYGGKLFNGIASVYTKEGDFILENNDEFPVYKKEMLPLSSTKTYFKPTYKTATSNARIPDYRYQLVWEPIFNLKEKANYSFYTSDVPGLYEITLDGFTSNGDPVSMCTQILVK
ncbi:hypothetical protein [Pustulibacterium marinum]|nr:hypothetical protein [Pustulibacterium marinum]